MDTVFGHGTHIRQDARQGMQFPQEQCAGKKQHQKQKTQPGGHPRSGRQAAGQTEPPVQKRNCRFSQ